MRKSLMVFLCDSTAYLGFWLSYLFVWRFMEYQYRQYLDTHFRASVHRM